MRPAYPAAAALFAAACAPAADPGETGRVRQEVGAWADGDPAAPIEAYVVLTGEPAVSALQDAGGASPDAPAARAAIHKRFVALEQQHDDLRPLLLDHGATILGELTRLANLFHVRMPRGRLDALARLPEVLRVEPVPLWQRQLATGVPLIGAPAVWSAPTPFRGTNIRIGILDSGIDYLHADFGGPGDPAVFEADDPTTIEPGSFPTQRVVGGIDFVGDAYNPEGQSTTPAPDPDPIDCGGHGSHVAGIAAGNGVWLDGSAYLGPYDMSFDPAAFSVGPGVAPEAQLYAIKVFGCDGPTTVVASGMEWAIDPNGDGFFDDRLDVVNASLGSGWGLESPTTKMLMEGFTAVGGLFVASAGNEGATFFVTGSPASERHVLSVAASVDNSFSTLTLHEPAPGAGDFAAAQAQFSARLEATGDVTAPLVRSDPPLGCAPLANAAAVAGKIALIERGDCLFLDKFVHAEAAGAAGVVIVNHTFEAELFAMAPPEGGGSSDLPGVMVSAEDGAILAQAASAGAPAVTLSAALFSGDGAELVAGLSSRGPRSEDGALKPEIAAPGVNIDSTDVGTGSAPTPKSGTSMASPFVAGAAALVRQAHPSLGPLDIKALLMNTAVPLRNSAGVTFPVSQQGAGRVDVARAASQQVTARLREGDGLIALSFGAITAHQVESAQREIEVINHGDETVSYTTAAALTHPRPGVSVHAEPADLTIPPGEARSVTLTLTLDPFALGHPPIDPVTSPTQFNLPRHYLVEGSGLVTFTDRGGHAAADQSLALPFHSVVRAAALRQADVPRGCFAPDQPVILSLDVTGGSAHPAPVTSAFELGAESERDENLSGDPLLARLDLRAVGVATDAAQRDDPSAASIHFGIAVEGEWTTPARGGNYGFTVHVDTDDDGRADFAIVPEAFNREEPWGDVLVSRTYDVRGCSNPFNLERCDPVATKRYFDLVPAGEADVRPFFNNVAVLSVFASDLGLGGDVTAFKYKAYSFGLFGAVDETDWASFDLRAPGLDTARHAPLPGRPLFIGDEPIVAELGAGVLPKLLVLHHTNVPAARWQVIALDNYQQPSVAVAHQLPAQVARARFTHQIRVENPTTYPMARVDVVASVSGARVELATSSHGSCDDAHCGIDDLDPEEVATITLHLLPLDEATSIEVRLTATPDVGCSLSVASATDLAAPETATTWRSAGGCGCGVDSRRDGRDGLWILALAGAALLRRRRGAQKL